DPLPRPHGRCSTGQDQEGRLKGVLGVVVVDGYATTNAEDHRAMTVNKGLKCPFVLLVDEGRQQLPIRPGILPQHRPAKMPNHRVHLSRRHGRPPQAVALDLYPLLPGQGQDYSLFRPSQGGARGGSAHLWAGGSPPARPTASPGGVPLIRPAPLLSPGDAAPP